MSQIPSVQTSIQTTEPTRPVTGVFADYHVGEFYDELFQPTGRPRRESETVFSYLQRMAFDDLKRRQLAADRSMLRLGITFNVYGDGEGTERIIPFDIVPRVLGSAEWDPLERGLNQRIAALNLFIDDIYHEQKIVKDGIVPEHVIQTAASFRRQCIGLNPPKGIWCHITGTDLVRHGDGTLLRARGQPSLPIGRVVCCCKTVS